MKGNFCGNRVVKTPPCDAGDKGSIPGQGTKISQALEQLGGPWAQTLQRAGAPQPRSRMLTLRPMQLNKYLWNCLKEDEGWNSDIFIHIPYTNIGFLFPNILVRKRTRTKTTITKNHSHASSKQIIYLIQCKYAAKFTTRDFKLLP